MENTPTPVPTGFHALDDLIGGLRVGEFAVLAARPAMGKTAIALQIALNAARTGGLPTLFFSLEMTKEQIGKRLLSLVGGVENAKLRSPSDLTGDELQRLADAAREIGRIPLFLEDKCPLAVRELQESCARFRAERSCRLVVVDYLQLLRLEDEGEASEDALPLRDEMSSVSRALKALAVELQVPVVAIAQINRVVEKRDDKRPVLDDLKPAGNVAEFADTVMFLYRDEVYRRDTPDRGVAEIIVAKEPQGRTGPVRLRFDGPMLRFGNLTDPMPPSVP